MTVMLTPWACAFAPAANSTATINTITGKIRRFMPAVDLTQTDGKKTN
jgi:hypothetical protein